MLRIQDPSKKSKQEEVGMTLDGLAREGARRMLMSALEEEVSDYIERNAQERNEDGHALVAVVDFFAGGLSATHFLLPMLIGG